MHDVGYLVMVLNYTDICRWWLFPNEKVFLCIVNVQIKGYITVLNTQCIQDYFISNQFLKEFVCVENKLIYYYIIIFFPHCPPSLFEIIFHTNHSFSEVVSPLVFMYALSCNQCQIIPLLNALHIAHLHYVFEQFVGTNHKLAYPPGAPLAVLTRWR